MRSKRGFDLGEMIRFRRERAKRLYEGLSFPHVCIDEGYVVYFIGDKQGRVKIGRSRNVKERLRMLQVGNADDLTLLATEPGRGRREAELQRQFAHLHLGGEWFRADKELFDYISALLCQE